MPLLRKTSLFFTAFLWFLIVKPQLNPVKNLQWSHWYQTPHNCFTLSWTQPDSSLTDSLIGYNIYRDTSFYRFTTSTIIYYNPCQSFQDTTDQYFLSYPNTPFFAHVAAVYNSSQNESGYDDSVFVGGVAISVSEIKVFLQKVFPTVLRAGNSLMNFAPALQHAEVKLYSAMGKVVWQQENVTGNQVSLECGLYPNGIYLIQVNTGEKVETIKIVVSQ